MDVSKFYSKCVVDNRFVCVWEFLAKRKHWNWVDLHIEPFLRTILNIWNFSAIELSSISIRSSISFKRFVQLLLFAIIWISPFFIWFLILILSLLFCYLFKKKSLRVELLENCIVNIYYLFNSIQIYNQTDCSMGIY